MSNFFRNLPYKLANFMAGATGPDALARASLWMGVLFTFLELITGLGICSLIGMVFLLYFMFRCFSRNIAARTRENARYIALTAKPRAAWARFNTRWDQRKTTKFLKCPQCGQSHFGAQGQGHAEDHVPEVPQPVHDEVVESQSSG